MNKKKFKKVVEWYEIPIEEEMANLSMATITILFVLFFAGGLLTGEWLTGIPLILSLIVLFFNFTEREVYWVEIK